MSKEIETFSDPGLPEHIHRRTDTDPIAEKKAEKQVALAVADDALARAELEVAQSVGDKKSPAEKKRDAAKTA